MNGIYTSLYKRWAATLVTAAADTNFFIPKKSEWRKESINLTPYLNSNPMLAFRVTNGFENNIYLDDININTVKINPNLRETGLLISPNPTKNIIKVQLYPIPQGLKAIQIFNSIGQKLAKKSANLGEIFASSEFNMTGYANGIYFVKIVFADRILTKKIIKQ